MTGEFFLTERYEAPRVPDFDGAGPRRCRVVDCFALPNGKILWLAEVTPPLRLGSRGVWTNVVLGNRYMGDKLDDVFAKRDPIMVHVVLVPDWDRVKESGEVGKASDFWGEITAREEDLPDIIVPGDPPPSLQDRIGALEAYSRQHGAVPLSEAIDEDGVDLRLLALGLATSYLKALDSNDPDRYLGDAERGRLEALPGWAEALEYCRRRMVGGLLFYSDDAD